MLRYEFKQASEFSKPYYDVIFYNEFDEYPVGYLYFAGGNWNYADYQEYGLPAHLMIEIGNKIKEFDKSVKEQLFLGRF
jgi:hypothetical protein